MSEAKRKYLQRFWLMIITALVLAIFPHSSWFIRFLCLLVFAILAGWTERANMEFGKRLICGK